MKNTRKALPIRLLLSLTLVVHLMVFAPMTMAAGFSTSRCTGEVTLSNGTTTITRAITFFILGSFTGPFSLTYSAIIRGVTYSASATGNCVAN